MKFLFMFLFTLSCTKPSLHNSEAPSSEDAEGVESADDAGDLSDISGSLEKPKRVQPAKSIDEKNEDRKVNPLRDEEVYLSLQRRRAQKRQRGFFSRDSGRNSDAVICRRFDGCQRFCADWMDKNIDCNKWPVKMVTQEWSSMLDSLSPEELIQNVQWMVLHPEVSVFLRAADFSQGVVDKMISRLSTQECPLSEGLDIYRSQNLENASLHLVHPEGRKAGEKTITDPQYFKVDVYAFKGAVSKCLDEKKMSLPELMLAHQNELGFQLIHQKIAHSCGHRDECVQLAYCKIQSEPVWTYLEQVKHSDAFNVDVQADKCSYEDFHSLPSL